MEPSCATTATEVFNARVELLTIAVVVVVVLVAEVAAAAGVLISSRPRPHRRSLVVVAIVFFKVPATIAGAVYKVQKEYKPYLAQTTSIGSLHQRPGGLPKEESASISLRASLHPDGTPSLEELKP